MKNTLHMDRKILEALNTYSKDISDDIKIAARSALSIGKPACCTTTHIIKLDYPPGSSDSTLRQQFHLERLNLQHIDDYKASAPPAGEDTAEEFCRSIKQGGRMGVPGSAKSWALMSSSLGTSFSFPWPASAV